MPQPYLVPVIFNSSRNTQSNGVLGSAVTSFCWPFTVSLYVSICGPHALLLWAGHAGFDPAAGSLHELRMRQRRKRAGSAILPSPRLPRVLHLRCLVMMLQQLRSAHILVFGAICVVATQLGRRY